MVVQPYPRSRANSLQFQSILVVAPSEIPPRLAWRKEGLLKAAAYTGLDIQVLHQPRWTDADTGPLISKGKELKHGCALSWLGHLNAIREAAKYSTSLIIEDDADWDVGLRTQIPRIAEAVRKLTNFRVDPEESKYPPYGLDWDVLWLGHCGDSLPFDGSPIRLEDPTVPPYINSWETKVSPNPNHIRWIHYSTGPICTYAYALTDISAKKILERDSHGVDPFDIWLHNRCKGREFRCITVNPELFHHHEIAGSKDSLINGKSGIEVIKSERTDNIWHSARCNSVSTTNAMVKCMGPEPKGDPKKG